MYQALYRKWRPKVFADVVGQSHITETLRRQVAEDADNQVWLLESVMRLAPTVGYQDGTLEDYNALRSYGAQPRPELGKVIHHGWLVGIGLLRVILRIIGHITSSFLPVIQNDLIPAVPGVIYNRILDTDHMAGQSKNIGPMWVLCCEIRYRHIISDNIPLEALPAQIGSPDSVA